MHCQGRNRETWQSYKWRGQAVEGRGSLGGQAWINNERLRAHADAFTYPDGGVVTISRLKLHTTEILLFVSLPVIYITAYIIGLI